MFSHGYNYQFCSSPLDYKREGEREGRREGMMVAVRRSNSDIETFTLSPWSLIIYFKTSEDAETSDGAREDKVYIII